MTNTCPPCNHDCNEGRTCPARAIPESPKWVGLTDLEILDIAKANSIYGSDNHYEVMEFVASIEERLKRKNT